MARLVYPCPRCSYDLTGTPWAVDVITCPECGQQSERLQIKAVEIPPFMRPLLMKISGPVAAMVVVAVMIQQWFHRHGTDGAVVYGSLFALATLWALFSPWIVVSGRVRTYRYSRWIAFDELAGAYGLNLVAGVVTATIAGMLLTR